MKLFIAEKPSLARAIAQALQSGHSARGTKALKDSAVKKNGYYVVSENEQVTWCIGHLLEQAQPHDYNSAYKRWTMTDLPIVPEQWQLRPKAQTAQQLKNISSLLKTATEIIHAGDPDREGQLLVDQVLHYLGVGTKVARGVPVFRLLIQDLNPDAIRASLKHLKPNSVYGALSTSALARQRADWLYGINMTRAYTLLGRQSGFDGLLSVGRVQTPVLGLVVRRDRMIAQFEPKPFYEVLAYLETQLPPEHRSAYKNQMTSGSSGSAVNERFTARWLPSKACEDHQDEQGRVLNRALAQHVAQRVTAQVAHVHLVKSKERKSPPPLPYSLSTLQVDVGRRYGLSAQKVLDCAQSLYEKHNLITYPRSDCRYLPLAHFKLAVSVSQAVGGHIRQFISLIQEGKSAVALKGLGSNDEAIVQALRALIDTADLKLKSSAWDDLRVGAHHAIIPTSKRVDIQRLTGDERLVYETVARQYLLQFFPAFRYQETEVGITISDGKFKTSAQVPLELGWRTIVGLDRQNQTVLPTLVKGQYLWSERGEVVEKMTSPPVHFTDASLIQAMTGISRYVESKAVRQVLKETDGLGTEATRAGIVELLVKRGFLIRRGRQILSTPSGSALVDVLPKVATLPDMTAQWESELGKMSQDKQLYCGFMMRLTQELIQFVEQVRHRKGEPLPVFSTLKSTVPHPVKGRFTKKKRVTKSRVKSAKA